MPPKMLDRPSDNQNWEELMRQPDPAPASRAPEMPKRSDKYILRMVAMDYYTVSKRSPLDSLGITEIQALSQIAKDENWYPDDCKHKKSFENKTKCEIRVRDRVAEIRRTAAILDWYWAHDNQQAMRVYLEDWKTKAENQGKECNYVAVFDKEFICAGEHDLEMKALLSHERGIPKSRVVVIYVGD